MNDKKPVGTTALARDYRGSKACANRESFEDPYDLIEFILRIERKI
jgi:hypothetical protein